MPVWNLDQVRLTGNQTDRLAIDSLKIGAGITAVLGHSGAGKSSLLNLLVGFEKPAHGVVEFLAADHSAQTSPRVFWSPQDHGLWPQLSVEEHIRAVQQTDDTRSPQEWLALFGLTSVADSPSSQLSMGERSRLAVLRALACRASCIVLDEPLAHIDASRVDLFWSVLEDEVMSNGITCVFSTHDPICVRRFADNCVCLNAGQLAFRGTPSVLLYQPPDAETAWLMGPANCLSTAMQQTIFKTSPLPKCIRPEEVKVTPASDGFEVRSVRPINGATACQLAGIAEPIYLAEWISPGRYAFSFSPAEDRSID